MYEADISMEHQQVDAAIEAANVALNGRRRRETSRFASIELRAVDPSTGAWEIAAVTCVGFATLIFVLGLWFY
jgi:hypothetical protein